MPELRLDPVSRLVTIIAPARGQRPGAFLITPNAKTTTTPCPFCPGSEDQTPSAVLSYPEQLSPNERSPNNDNPAGSWELRVVPNLFPATIHTEAKPASNDFFASQPSAGYHEVVIESSRHIRCFSELSLEYAELVFLAYAERFRDWRRHTDVKFGIAFKNNGAAAGASLEHAHSQLVGLPRLPAGILAEREGARAHFEQTGQCVFCDMIARELQRNSDSTEQTRIVTANETFVVLCPFASRVPYEMWVLPRHHTSHFDRAGDDVIKAAGRVVHEMLTRLSHLIEDVPYNYLLHTAPFDTPDEPYYHWHVEIIPRITREPGFEWGTGCHINPMFPEQAAARLRSV